ncbi:MAG TPA: extracellular solute-binding protein [Treponemataceae bacterium]|nr:extracellular solute-binding protein [Treponemataceae bacterium]
MRQFQQENPDILVSSEYLPTEAYLEKLDLSLQTGDAPDVFMMSSGMTARFISGSAPFLRLDALDRDGAFKDCRTALLTPISKYGAKYGMPVSLSMRMLFYNKDILRQYGIPYPSETEPLSWEALISILESLKNASDSRYTAVIPMAARPEDLMESLLQAYQTPLFSDTVNQNTSVLVRSRATAAFGVLDELYREGLISTFDNDTDNALRGGNFAFAYAGAWTIPILNEAYIDYGTIPLPSATARGPTAEVNYLMISPDCQKQEAAWRLVEWFATKGQRYMRSTAEFPAHSAYDPMAVARSAQSGLHRTFDSERNQIVPALAIANPIIKSEYLRCVRGIADGSLKPDEAVSGLITVLNAELGKGQINE